MTESMAIPTTGEPDPEALKGFNRQFVTGVTVVSTIDEGVARGLAVNAYCSISFDPPLVMVCIQRTSSTWPALFAATHLGVNVLSNQQREIGRASCRERVRKRGG